MQQHKMYETQIQTLRGEQIQLRYFLLSEYKEVFCTEWYGIAVESVNLSTGQYSVCRIAAISPMLSQVQQWLKQLYSGNVTPVTAKDVLSDLAVL